MLVRPVIPGSVFTSVSTYIFACSSRAFPWSLALSTQITFSMLTNSLSSSCISPSSSVSTHFMGANIVSWMSTMSAPTENPPPFAGGQVPCPHRLLHAIFSGVHLYVRTFVHSPLLCCGLCIQMSSGLCSLVLYPGVAHPPSVVCNSLP